MKKHRKNVTQIEQSEKYFILNVPIMRAATR